MRLRLFSLAVMVVVALSMAGCSGGLPVATPVAQLSDHAQSNTTSQGHRTRFRVAMLP